MALQWKIWVEKNLNGKSKEDMEMKKYFMIFAAALIAFAACQEEMTPEINTNEGGILDYPIEMTFTADNETAAKTAISGTEVMWESDDEIKVLWSNTGNNKATAEPYNSNRSANFTTTVEAADAYYAVHPYAAESSFVDGNVVVKVPAVQGGAFEDANIAIAKADKDNAFLFRHLVGMIEFTTDTPGKVTISGAEGDVLTGTVTVTGFDDQGHPQYNEDKVTDASSVIEIDVKASGTYYAAFLPSATLKYLSIKVGEGEAAEYALSGNQLQMSRGKVWELGNITKRLNRDYFVKADADGNGDGKTWETAFTYQQMANFVAANCPEVSGVAGTNTDVAATGFAPTNMSADEYRTWNNTERAAKLNGVTFHMAAGAHKSSAYLRISFPERGSAVKMTFKGGYPSTASGRDLSGRDPETNVTIIDGEKKRRLFFVRYYSDIVFDGISFENGWVNTSGGALLFNESATSTVAFNNCDFKNNKSTATSGQHGGVACAKNDAGNLSFTGCKFIGNKSETYGGVIYAASANSNITFKNCEFTQNTSVNNGGVAHLNPVKLAVFDACTFSSNSVTGTNMGGVAYLSGASNLTVKNAKFTNNTAGKSGGALYHSGTGTISILGSTFDGNSAGAEHGGAIYGSGVATWNISTSEFKNNSSVKDGGAILFYKGTWNVSETKFVGNSAAGNGGTIYANTGSLNLSKCEFNSNSTSTTGVGGGGIYVTTNAVLSVDASKFISNTAPNKNGGAINIAGSAAGLHKINNTHFSGNGAKEGGAVFVAAGCTLYVNGSSFSGNVPSTGDTGGVMKTSATTFMNNCSFCDNVTGAWQADLILCGTATVLNTTVIEKSSASSSTHTNGIRVYGASSSAMIYNNVILTRNRNLAAGYGSNVGDVTSQGYNYTGKWSTQVNSGVAGSAKTIATDNIVTPTDVFDSFTKSAGADAHNWYTWTAPEGINMTTLADMTAFLNGVSGGSDFATWLNTVNGLSHDIAGNPRPSTGSIYPGCYQK